MDESLPNSRDEKHETIIKMLNENLNKELRHARLGVPDHREIMHLQRQINYHKSAISSNLA